MVCIGGGGAWRQSWGLLMGPDRCDVTPVTPPPHHRYNEEMETFQSGAGVWYGERIRVWYEVGVRGYPPSPGPTLEAFQPQQFTGNQ